MAKIKFIETGATTEVSATPRWADGMWDCGDRRFLDPEQTLYAAVPEYAPLTPVQFYIAFTPAERIAIKASVDPMVKEFWETYQLAVQTNTPIDPNLVSVQGGLAYLATAAPAGPGILAAAARVAQISQGTPQ